MDESKTDELIRYDEGIRGRLYTDTAGNPTIGIGMNLNTESLPNDLAQIWSSRKRDSIAKDLMKRLDFFSSLDDVRQAALVDMGYNMGVDGLLAFTTTLDLIRRKKYTEAAMNLTKTKYYKESGLRGPRIGKMISTGLWPEFIC